MYDIVIIDNEKDSASPLIDQYVNLRACETSGVGIYKAQRDEFDICEHTLFFLCVEKDSTVVGGARVVFKSDCNKLKLETGYDLDIGSMLPHLDLEALKVAELSGVVVSHNRRGQNIGRNLQKSVFDYMADNPSEIDILSAIVTVANANCLLKIMGDSDDQVASVVRTDYYLFRGSEPRILVMAAGKDSGIELLSRLDKEKKVGMPITHDIKVLGAQLSAEKEHSYIRPLLGVSNAATSHVIYEYGTFPEEACKFAR